MDVDADPVLPRSPNRADSQSSSDGSSDDESEDSETDSEDGKQPVNDGAEPASAPKSKKRKSTAGKHIWRQKYETDFPWIMYDTATGRMRCKHCVAAKQRGNLEATGKWVDEGVTSIKPAAMKKHLKNKLHLQLIRDTATGSRLENQVVRVQDSNRSAVIRSMQAIYYLAKSELAQTHFIGLKRLIGNMGLHLEVESSRKDIKYESEQFITEVIGVLSRQIKDAQVTFLTSKLGVLLAILRSCCGDVQRQEFTDAPYVALMCDESTDASNFKQCIVYGRYVDKWGRIQTRFLELERLGDGSAATIQEAIELVVKEWQIPWTKVCAFGSDGAAVMTGVNTGVAKRLTGKNGFLTSVHCVAHRLALVASDACEENDYLKLKFVGNLQTLYYWVSNSSNRASDLADLHAAAGLKEYSLKEAKYTRWLSIDNSTKALRRSFKQVLLLLSGEKKDAAGQGLYKIMRTYLFAAVLCLFCDVFPTLSRLSKTFQSSTVDLSMVGPCVASTISNISRLAEHDGEHLQQLDALLDDLATKPETTITVGEKDRSRFANIRKQFIASLRDRLQARFPDMRLLDAFAAVFNPALLDKLGTALQEYGNSELKVLQEHYCVARKVETSRVVEEKDAKGKVVKREILIDMSAVVLVPATDELSGQMLLTEYAQLKGYWIRTYAPATKRPGSMQELCERFIADPSSALSYPRMRQLAHLALIIPVATADCERGFSTQNRVKTDDRSSLSQQKLNDLMRISMHGPDLELFDWEAGLRAFKEFKKRRVLM